MLLGHTSASSAGGGEARIAPCSLHPCGFQPQRWAPLMQFLWGLSHCLAWPQAMLCLGLPMNRTTGVPHCTQPDTVTVFFHIVICIGPEDLVCAQGSSGLFLHPTDAVLRTSPSLESPCVHGPSSLPFLTPDSHIPASSYCSLFQDISHTGNPDSVYPWPWLLSLGKEFEGYSTGQDVACSLFPLNMFHC